MSRAGEMAREMERVSDALARATAYLAGHDQADSARQLTGRVTYSPLRTLLEQASGNAERVETYLRERS
jgi:hypothetical protein